MVSGSTSLPYSSSYQLRSITISLPVWFLYRKPLRSTNIRSSSVETSTPFSFTKSSTTFPFSSRALKSSQLRMTISSFFPSCKIYRRSFLPFLKPVGCRFTKKYMIAARKFSAELVKNASEPPFFSPPPLFRDASRVAAVSEAAARSGMYLR